MRARRQLGAASISVVIPAFNAETTIARALRSAANQTRAPHEIIVVDDASTDGTSVMARRCGPVRVIALEQRGGAAKARNVGIGAAEGTWIAFLDADDEWLPLKLERQMELVQQRDDGCVAFCASEEFAADGTSLGDTFRGGCVDCGSSAWKHLLKRNFIATPTVLAPRARLLELGGFVESLPVAEDQDMWIRLALSGALAYVPEVLVHVHRQLRSLSSYRARDQSRHVIPMIMRHLKQRADQLAPAERRGILAERLANAGRIAFANGDCLRGAEFMVRSLLYGYRPDGGAGSIARRSLESLMRRAMTIREIAL